MTRDLKAGHFELTPAVQDPVLAKLHEAKDASVPALRTANRSVPCAQRTHGDAKIKRRAAAKEVKSVTRAITAYRRHLYLILSHSFFVPVTVKTFAFKMDG